MFTKLTFSFLDDLAAYSDRAWFEANKSRYEDLVREPALDFIAAMEPELAKFAPNFRAEARKVGGSLMRFSRDKTPYKLLADIGAGGRQLPLLAKETVGELHDRLRALDERTLAYDRKISALAKTCEPARRLMAIEGVCPVTATAWWPAWAMPAPSRAGDSLPPGWG